MAHDAQRYEDLRTAVVHVDGDMDMAVVPKMKADLADLIEAGYVNIVFELSCAKYVDSSALSLLVWLDRELTGTSGKVVLVGANKDIARVLAISGLVAVTQVECSEETLGDILQGVEIVSDSVEPVWTEEFSMAGSAAALASVRERVCELVETLKFSDAALFDIKVALGEALANAVRHGSPGDGNGMIGISVRAFEDKVEIEVVDTGAGFDGEHVCSDDLYASGGRGIMFMRALMDRVAFRPAPSGGTTVTLVKHRAPPEIS
ncbi:MAG: anti-sigma factor antagonist [Coriobacteriia bacterium]|nr:anti-sigma factor antagonist [Coriobacteriia bacterium]